jgi:hypothetical protein
VFTGKNNAIENLLNEQERAHITLQLNPFSFTSSLVMQLGTQHVDKYVLLWSVESIIFWG